MNLGLNGKTALVLGGGSGLGKAIAKALAEEGARVAVAGRTKENLDKTVEEIVSAGGEAMGLPWDISDLQLIDKNATLVEQRFGKVGVLINNSGGPPPTPAAGQDPNLWTKSFQSMILSLIAITDRVLPGMREQGWGRVITSASSGVVSPIPNLAISNTLRLSLLGWSKTLSSEVAKDGITVNVVLPGRIATDRITVLNEAKAKREGRSLEDVSKESLTAIPIGRLGSPEEYANVVAFLASTAASYVTGSVIRVDGGANLSI